MKSKKYCWQNFESHYITITPVILNQLEACCKHYTEKNKFIEFTKHIGYVSPLSIHRILNGEQKTISPETVKKIEQVAKAIETCRTIEADTAVEQLAPRPAEQQELQIEETVAAESPTTECAGETAQPDIQEANQAEAAVSEEKKPEKSKNRWLCKKNYIPVTEELRNQLLICHNHFFAAGKVKELPQSIGYGCTKSIYGLLHGKQRVVSIATAQKIEQMARSIENAQREKTASEQEAVKTETNESTVIPEASVPSLLDTIREEYDALNSLLEKVSGEYKTICAIQESMNLHVNQLKATISRETY